MTSFQLALLLSAACIGGLIFGVAGFAFGVVASLFLHHGFVAGDVVFIVVSGALLLNLALLPRFWREISLRRSIPYLVGATLGLPIGLTLLRVADARWIRLSVATIVAGYCLFALRQRSRAPLQYAGSTGQAADTAVGLAGGIVGGVSGLGPLVPGIWFGLRGMHKTEQRGMMQPYGLYVQGVMVGWLLLTGSASRTALEGIAIAAPFMLLAATLGLRVFDRLSTGRFQLIVMVSALAGALLLIARQW